MVFTNNQYFASLAEVSAMINLGTIDFTESDLDSCLPIMQGVIHDFLISLGVISAGPVLSTGKGYQTIRAQLLDIIQRWRVRRNSNKEGRIITNAAAVMNEEYNLTDANMKALGQAFFGGDDCPVDCIPTYHSQRLY